MSSKAESNRINGMKGGRPKGSFTKPRLKDYISEEEVKAIIDEAKAKAKEGDTGMLKFVLEQIFGKAPQSMDVTSDGKAINISFDESFKEK